ncbi:hypothetical protein [Streptococcus parauberis]|uniref:hypothetical protein n=1 Tax=Streptococcus parauberis TaxID=1348 RepID=UPI0002B90FD4|nr:hypothetical protein [Streptococcus parauberis]QBX09919.1 hypothetical protein JavanS398_0003 [Streptococcus satellite phage Javan398]EMF48732.1 repressor-related protein [Streptococcus parauberis KRS-02109]UWM86922.1 hypothetical protein N2A93_10045 [Streptococcus parauberis]UWM88896.1 hypothetical protein N2A96_10045 [Streptococcus parauberis]WEM59658.1 hypothetical protein P1T47_09835 [Streptococcus parauberis]
MEITELQARSIRRRQADKNKTSSEIAKEIGISPITYRKVKNGSKVRTSTYKKIMLWLTEDL